MNPSVILAAALLVSRLLLVTAQCSDFVPIHDIVSAPVSVYTFQDEFGDRQIRARTFGTPDCAQYASRPTGVAVAANDTIMSQRSSFNGCEVKDVNGVRVIDSLQAIVISTNGWLMHSPSFFVSDVDSNSWRELFATFALRGNQLVLPNITLNPNSVLAVQQFNVPAQITEHIRLSIGHVTVPGAAFNITNDFNCPISDSVLSSPCSASVNFNSPVDTLVIMYALVDRGEPATQSGIVVSELQMDCGCRCRQTDMGDRTITVPASGQPGQCTRRQTTSLKTECDVLGDQWCKIVNTIDYNITSAVQPNGNFECSTIAASGATILSEFSPDIDFAGDSL